MAKTAKIETAKIHVYASILSAWDSIPRDFSLSDLQQCVPELQHMSVFSVQKQLYHMKELNMIKLTSRKVWHKTYVSLGIWWSYYIKELEKQQESKITVLKKPITQEVQQ
jgi:hypothetical protein